MPKNATVTGRWMDGGKIYLTSSLARSRALWESPDATLRFRSYRRSDPRSKDSAPIDRDGKQASGSVVAGVANYPPGDVIAPVFLSAVKNKGAECCASLWIARKICSRRI